jgi:hypothetical protein
MRPSTTKYRLVKPGGEFNKLYALAKRVGMPLATGTLNWPTVAAERDGKVIGFLSTLPTNEAILAGPLVIEHKSMLTAIRLIEAYEVVLKAAGVRTYLAQTAPKAVEWAMQLERMGFTVVNADDDRILLRRDIWATS